MTTSRSARLAGRIYVDMDGVLADFDRLALEVVGEPRSYEATHGTQAFWKRIGAVTSFYRRLPKMVDADVLMAGVARVALAPPIILTGVPTSIPTAADEKRAWAAEHFPGVQVITCFSKDKARYCLPGDTLIDDWPKYKALWEAAGGRFIVHTSAAETLQVLAP